MRSRTGELFGIANLLSYTGHTIKTLDVLDAHKHKVRMLLERVSCLKVLYMQYRALPHHLPET
jgi:hypothetical protein